jgi:hypothetical protein
MTEGSVGEWKFKEGEAFSASDVLMTVETDKGKLYLVRSLVASKDRAHKVMSS